MEGLTELQIKSKLVAYFSQYEQLTLDIIKSDKSIEVIKNYIELLPDRDTTLRENQKLAQLFLFFIMFLRAYVNKNNTVENFLYIQKLIRTFEVFSRKFSTEGKIREGQSARSKLIEIIQQELTPEEVERNWSVALETEVILEKLFQASLDEFS